MPFPLSNYLLANAAAQLPPVKEPVIPQPNNILQNTLAVRNSDIGCVNIYPTDKSYHPLRHGYGRKLESIKTSFENQLRSLKKYNISINTKAYTQTGPSGLKETKEAIDKNFISFVHGTRPGKTEGKAIRFKLPKHAGDYRVELAHRNNLTMNTDSLYEFDWRSIHAAHDAIFFQVKESGGDMKTKGGGKPPLSLHLRNEKDIYVAINSENGNVLRQKIATLNCPEEWYKFKVRIVWNRNNPGIQVTINGKDVFQTNAPFGAHNSKHHYSKFGIYIPQQKNKTGIKHTSFLFKNVKENHRSFKHEGNPHKAKTRS